MSLKQILSTVFSLTLMSYNASAQGHIPQTSAFNLAVARSPLSTAFSGGYHLFFNRKLFVTGQVNLESGNAHEFKYQSFSTDFLANYELLSINGTFYLNGGIGPSLTYEELKPNGLRAVNYGGTLKLECETFVIDAFSILLFADQTLMVRQNLGRQRAKLGLGFRFFL